MKGDTRQNKSTLTMSPVIKKEVILLLQQQWWIQDTPVGGRNGTGNTATSGAPPSYNTVQTETPASTGPTDNEAVDLDRLLTDLTVLSEGTNISPTAPPGLPETPPDTCPSTAYPETTPPPAYHDVTERGFVDISKRAPSGGEYRQ